MHPLLWVQQRPASDYAQPPMNKRALILALVVAVLGFTLMLLYAQRFEKQASGGDRVQLLMAIKPIQRGAVISDDSLAIREVPLAYVEDRAVKAAEKSKVLGLRVGNTVQSQQTLMWSDLSTTADEMQDLSMLVERGKRAVQIRASSGDKTFALIRPGNYVDVIATIPEPGGTGDRRTAVVLLQRALVLAVGLEVSTEINSSVSDRNRGKGAEDILTLSLDLHQAQQVALALNKGVLTVVTRNSEDQVVLEGVPDLSSSVLTDPKVRQPGQTGGRGPVKLEVGGSRR